MRPERSDQRVLFVMRQAGEVGKLGHPELESWPPWSRQSPFDSQHTYRQAGEMSRYQMHIGVLQIRLRYNLKKYLTIAILQMFFWSQEDYKQGDVKCLAP